MFLLDFYSSFTYGNKEQKFASISEHNSEDITQSDSFFVFLLNEILLQKVANHAARWNEAISVVKRVPLIRPALPSSVGMMNQWSMMSLR